MPATARPPRPLRGSRPPLPVVAPVVGDGTMRVGQLAIALTVIGWTVHLALTVSSWVDHPTGQPGAFGIGSLIYLVVVTSLACSALAYLTTRLGYYSRTRRHHRTPRAELVQPFESEAPVLTVLVPSYQEEERVNRMTLLSAALQEYPDLEVVLLIDDPPTPRYAGPARRLAAARRLPAELQALLDVPCERYRAAWDALEASRATEAGRGELQALAREYSHAARWLDALADDYTVTDHSDQFIVDQVRRVLATDLRTNERALLEAADEGAVLPLDHARHLYRRLTWIFSARLSSFERKSFDSLSHEPNKAMNLNSYISLMGGSYSVVGLPGGGRALLRGDHDPDLEVRDPDYVLTLDADSLLLPEYCLRIVQLLEQAEHSRVAVAQAPYTSFPSARTRLERIAGATTDIQYMLHQGMTHFGATFWVGANAVLRKKAIDELALVSHDGDWTITRYISDRTVIEDTESSIDLGGLGWRLLNYPERLSYSATPADFGALCIQRQRWANGGLLILPRLWRQHRSRQEGGGVRTWAEVFLRMNYMASIAWTSVALVLLLAVQFSSDAYLSPVLLLISVPYFAMMAVDLRHCGYRATDVFGVYGFNLILLPVNLSGVFSSLLQVLIGGRPAFRRTPKVRSRTTTGLVFVLAPYVLVAYSLRTLQLDVERGLWFNAGLAALNAVLAAYAIVAYIGVINSVVDVWHNVLAWFYVQERPSRRRRVRTPVAMPAPPTGRWDEVLAYAPAAGVRRAERRSASSRGSYDPRVHGERRGAPVRVSAASPGGAAGAAGAAPALQATGAEPTTWAVHQ